MTVSVQGIAQTTVTAWHKDPENPDAGFCITGGIITVELSVEEARKLGRFLLFDESDQVPVEDIDTQEMEIEPNND